MKIRLIKPMPQRSLGKVIPAGAVIDAPDGLWERLLRDGTGVPAHTGEAPAEGSGSTESGGAQTVPTEPKQPERKPQKASKGADRRKVKRDV